MGSSARRISLLGEERYICAKPYIVLSHFLWILVICQPTHGRNCHAKVHHLVQGISIHVAFMGTSCIPMAVILGMNDWRICLPTVSSPKNVFCA